MQNSKKILRNDAKTIRDAIPENRRTDDAATLNTNLMTAIEPRTSKESDIIATYYPIGSEIHPPHVLEGYRLALPVVRHKTTLEFYPWDKNQAVVKRDFNIPIPATRHLKPVLPQVILLPLLLCDQNGNRIGYGAGHYDRYIASLDYKPLLIGVCFDEQVSSESLPAESHDVRLDLIITPKRTIEIS